MKGNGREMAREKKRGEKKPNGGVQDIMLLVQVSDKQPQKHTHKEMRESEMF